MFRIDRRFQLGVLLICASSFLLVCHAPASADVASSERKLGPWARDLKVGPGMDASGRILRECVFVGLDLKNANFEGADLGGCEFFQCDLRNANFKNAIFAGLWWNECNIEGANFTDATINDTKPASARRIVDIRFTAAQFMSTRSYKTKKLSKCVIRVASVNDKRVPYKFDFRDADLRGAIFRHCDLRKSDFTNARIQGADFAYSSVTGEQITSTREFKGSRDLNGVSFGGVDGPVDLSGGNLSGSWIPPAANIEDATIINCKVATLRPGQLLSTKSYKDGQLTGIKFFGTDLAGVDFAAQDLSGCSFRGCNLVGATFEDAVISGTTFSTFKRKKGYVGLTLAQIKSTWNYKHGRMAGIRLPEDIAAALEAERKGEKEAAEKD